MRELLTKACAYLQTVMWGSPDYAAGRKRKGLEHKNIKETTSGPLLSGHNGPAKWEGLKADKFVSYFLGVRKNFDVRY